MPKISINVNMYRDNSRFGSHITFPALHFFVIGLPNFNTHLTLENMHFSRFLCIPTQYNILGIKVCTL
jgi:hypothetical protein